MRGRILTIKKSTWTMLSLIINSSCFVIGSLISFLVLNQYNYWFFLFCLFLGVHLIVKSCMFKFDSCCYFGVLLFFIGAFYFYCLYLNIYKIYPIFLILSFSIASYITSQFYHQPFQFFLSLSLIFVAVGLLLYIINYISLLFFLAFLLASVLILIMKFLTI